MHSTSIAMCVYKHMYIHANDYVPVYVDKYMCIICSYVCVCVCVCVCVLMHSISSCGSAPPNPKPYIHIYSCTPHHTHTSN